MVCSVGDYSNITAKGRSASRRLRRLQQHLAPPLVGNDLYVGVHFCPTRKNKTDGGTRGRGVDPPGYPRPAWLAALMGRENRSRK